MRAAARITNKLVQEWIEHFLKRNEDYSSDPMPGFPEGFENADVLGVQGQFGEIWRKVWKLYKGMWQGKELTGEPTREVLLDMIGHCFLAIDMLDRQNLARAEKFAGVKAELFPEEKTPPKRRSVCGSACAEGHGYGSNCALAPRHDGGGML